MRNVVLFFAVALTLTSCNDADIASRNLSQAADRFEVTRRIVFYNGITGDYILTIEGLCSIGNQDKPGEVSITCKVGPSAYKKHFLGRSDNVTFFAEQTEGVSTDVYHYQVTFKPAVLLPSIKTQL